MPGVTTAYQAGVHGSRPAANSGCILYSCSTHGLVYRSDGTTWTTWLTLPSGVSSAAPALTFGTSAAAGAASTYVATDATLPIFDATVPGALNAPAAAGSAGSAGVAARRDHGHPSPLLAIKAYTGGTSPATSSTSLAIADGTNLAVTFTVPASGQVVVRLTAACNADTNASHAGTQTQWGLIEGASTVVAGPANVIRDINGNGSSFYTACSVCFVISGLTPGASKTYKWAHLTTNAASNTIIYAATTNVALMEVLAA